MTGFNPAGTVSVGLAAAELLDDGAADEEVAAELELVAAAAVELLEVVAAVEVLEELALLSLASLLHPASNAPTAVRATNTPPGRTGL
ncbi:MAG: hypothetical protein ABI051_17500 [Vicinamibacterales bacterium]